MSRLAFKIYVAGINPRNKHLISMFEKVCMEKITNYAYDIEVIDILKNPEKTETMKILAVPTIVREKPGPEKRIIGELADKNKAEQALHFLLNDLINYK